jgi:YggT family protein
MSFIIQTVFDIYIYIVILRLLLQAIRIRFDNPFSEFAIRFTQPLIGPLQKHLPEIKHIDLAILLFACILEMVKFSLLILLTSGGFPNIGGLFLISVADLVRHFTNFYFYAIVFRIIFSFVVLMRYNTLVFTITQLTEPLLGPIRRRVPLVSGFDLSPVIALIGLVLLERFVIGVFGL